MTLRRQQMLLLFIFLFFVIDCFQARRPSVSPPDIPPSFRLRDSLDKGEYCASYRLNYEFYCHGIWTGEKLFSIMTSRHYEKIRVFCPTFKRNCISRASDTYEERPHRKWSRQERHRFQKDLKSKMSYEDILDELAEIHPCTPQCDQRKFAHCTEECKCNYDFDLMNRFCNPPTNLKVIDTCRVWYYRCAHYPLYRKKWKFHELTEDQVDEPEPIDELRKLYYASGKK